LGDAAWLGTASARNGEAVERSLVWTGLLGILLSCSPEIFVGAHPVRNSDHPQGGGGGQGDGGGGSADGNGAAGSTGGGGDEGDDDGGGSGSGDGGGSSDPDCYDEPYFPDADISDLRSAYTASAWEATVFSVLERRYPAGHDLLDEMRDDPYIELFAEPQSFGTLMASLDTIVHEETHGWNYQNSIHPTRFSYWLRADLIYTPRWYDGFARSEIADLVEGNSTSLYASTYLVGTQGTYGFAELMDELDCYINGLGAVASLGEEMPYGFSARDGAVAFLYYLELYLYEARTEHSEIYASLQSDSEVVDLVRTQWLRTHFFLQFADESPKLGIYDDEIRELLYDPDNQREIEDFIGQELEASHCLP